MILMSLPARFRPKVIAIQVAKKLNKLSFENLICSLKSHEIELVGDEHTKKSKSIALTSKGKWGLESLERIDSNDSVVWVLWGYEYI